MNIDIGMSNSRPTAVPLASLYRLPQYHRFLSDLRDRGISEISCSLIGQELNCLPVLVRKDLQYTGAVGKPKTGYMVSELISTIERFLGWDSNNKAFLAGAGSLGTALLGHERFASFGLHIIAAFDSDPGKIGSSIHGRTVLPIASLAQLAQQMQVHLGILTAPAESAQSIAEEMVEGGIEAIWNFAPIRLKLPAHIILQNEDLYSSLSALSWRLARRFQTL